MLAHATSMLSHAQGTSATAQSMHHLYGVLSTVERGTGCCYQVAHPKEPTDLVSGTPRIPKVKDRILCTLVEAKIRHTKVESRVETTRGRISKLMMVIDGMRVHLSRDELWWHGQNGRLD